MIDLRRDGGMDAITGQHPDPLPQRWFGAAFPMANFVTMKGCEHFFAPSMSFLTGLGRDRAVDDKD